MRKFLVLEHGNEQQECVLQLQKRHVALVLSEHVDRYSAAFRHEHVGLHVLLPILPLSCSIYTLCLQQLIARSVDYKCVHVLIDGMDRICQVCLDLHPNPFQAMLSFLIGFLHRVQDFSCGQYPRYG